MSCVAFQKILIFQKNPKETTATNDRNVTVCPTCPAVETSFLGARNTGLLGRSGIERGTSCFPIKTAGLPQVM